MLSTKQRREFELRSLGSPKIRFSNFFSQDFLMFLGPRDGLELPEQLSPVINFAVIPLFSRTRESVTSGYPLQASWYRRTFQPFGRSVGRVLDKPDGRIATAFFESAPVAPPSKTSFFRKA